MKMIKKIGILFCLLISSLSITRVYAEESSYKNVITKAEKGVTLKIEWNDPTLGQETTFHVSASGGTGKYKYYFESPVYYNPGETYYEVIQDPTKVAGYTSVCETYDYKFALTASGTYGLNFAVMDVGVTPVTIVNNEIKVAVSDSSYPSVNTIASSAVTQCNAETDGSDYARALWLHDWLISQMEYDYSYLWASAESALTRHKGTCQSYEDAYELLLNTAGIKNAEIRDTYDTHTWNAAYLDGEWYQIDCTNDDSSIKFYYSDQSHLYFGLTDELMAIAHNGHNKIYTESGYSTRSTSLKNNYYVRNGDAEKWAKTYQDRIQEHLNNKETVFTISADNKIDQDKPTISGIYTGIIAYAMNQMSWKSDNDIVTLNAAGDTTQFTFTASYSDSSSHVHSWTSTVTKEATCETTGLKTFTCTICKQTTTSVLNALGHNYQWIQTKAPTCTESGSKSEICTRCNETRNTSIIYAKGHSYKWKTTKDATCGTDGIKKYMCNDCGDVSEIQTISATGNHTWNDGVVTLQPTCETTGLKTFTCTTCKQTTTSVLNALGHNYQWVQTKAPTCTDNGSKLEVCTRCNKTRNTSIIYAKGHSYEWRTTKEATCGTDGIKKYMCNDCGGVSDTQTIPATGNHTWNDGVLTKQSSNISTGIKTYTCSTCGTTRTEQIARTQSGYRNQWVYINNGWYYFDGSGNMVMNRWQGNYYLGSDGRMVTDQWVGDCYFGSNGAYIPNGWRSNSTGWWYRYGDGNYPTNRFVSINGATYYFNGSGYMVIGWRCINNSWYHFNGSGAMTLNRWQGNYYLGSDGKMATNQWIGNWYVGSNGEWVQAGWKHNSTGWWYQYVTGGYPVNKFESISGATYYFNGSGYMATGWRYINNSWYYFNGSGAMVVNRWQGNYYLGSDGRMVMNQWIGNWYVGNDGAWIPNYS